MPIGRAAIVLVLLCAPACAPATTPEDSNSGTRPNVLFILVDTLRPDHLGVYGYGRQTSPEIDALAREGVRFVNAVSAAPWTVPSTASIFTSLYPSVHGVIEHDVGVLGVLDEGFTTLAEVLAAGGYQTSAIVSNPWLAPDYRLNQGFQSYTMVPWNDAATVTSAAESWLDGRSSAPFFLYLHYMDAHGPYHEIPPPYDRMFSREDAPRRRLTRGEVAEVPRYWKLAPRPDLRDYVILYDREIRFLDAEIGRLLAKLETLGVRDDTLVVLTSDHGLEFLEHGGWDMGYTLYDENLRVPLILSLPEKLPRNRQITSQVRSIDIMPTILGILGIDLQHEIQGRDLNPEIAQTGEIAVDALGEAVYKNQLNQIKSLRTERFKLIDDAGTGVAELYDLTADSGERDDLLAASAEQTQELAARLRQRLEAGMQANQQARKPYRLGEGKPLDPETARKLRSLGYID